MTPHWEVSLARPGDDPALRRLLRTTPMPGRVELAFEREPDYFLGDGVLGERTETAVIRAGGEVVAMACRAARRAYVGGAPVRVGYLGQLRVAPEHRGRMLVTRGLRFLRERQVQDPLAGYYATITEGNAEAEGALLRRRGGGRPEFTRLDTLHTLALTPTRGSVRALAGRDGPADVALRPAALEELGAVAAFLARHGARRQLFPALAAADLAAERPRGLAPSDILLAHDGRRLVGVLALWEQSAFKQTVVRRYRGGLATLRPLLDLARRARGARPLPGVGARVRAATVSFPCVEGDDPAVFAALLGAALREARRRGLHALLLGLCAGDPLLRVARRAPHVAYRSALYAVSFDEPGFAARLEGVRHVELATL